VLICVTQSTAAASAGNCRWEGVAPGTLQVIGFDMGGTSTDVSRYAVSWVRWILLLAQPHWGLGPSACWLL
jgi:hypothetical protein